MPREATGLAIVPSVTEESGQQWDPGGVLGAAADRIWEAGFAPFHSLRKTALNSEVAKPF